MNRTDVFPAAVSLAFLVTLSPRHFVTLSLAKDLDLTRAVVLTPPGLTGRPARAVRMLVEEVEQRSMVRWDRAEKWPAAGTPVTAEPRDRVGNRMPPRSLPKKPVSARRDARPTSSARRYRHPAAVHCHLTS